jgi:hypothetical protein
LLNERIVLDPLGSSVALFLSVTNTILDDYNTSVHSNYDRQRFATFDVKIYVKRGTQDILVNEGFVGSIVAREKLIYDQIAVVVSLNQHFGSIVNTEDNVLHAL